MSPQPKHFVIEAGPLAGKVVVLPPSPLLVGRENTSDLVIPDPEVSRRHARFVPVGDGFRLEDLGSTNGSYVNDRRVTAPVLLSPGDIIRLGDNVVFRYNPEGVSPGLTAPNFSVTPDTPPRGLPLAGTDAFSAASMEPLSGYQPAPIYYTGRSDMLDEGSARPRWRRRLLGCGCLLLLAAIACGSAVFWLDANQPELLYGPLRALLELIGLGG